MGPLTLQEVQAAGGYSVIYSDPPWNYKDRTPTGGAEAQYRTTKTQELACLPVERLAAPDCLHFMWGTFPQLYDALTVMKAWGFEYKTMGFIWVKTTVNGNLAFGQGRYTRGNPEPCFIGVRGRGIDLVKDHAVRNLILTGEFGPEDDTLIAPIGEHSAKPSEARRRIETLCGDVPRIELFARERVQGWDSWGNEVESDVIFP